MNAIWKQNRDRRRLRRKQALMRHAENVWRAEIERLRQIIATAVIRGK